MSIVLESSMAMATINEMGAELSSFILKETEVEYIWQGDPTFWGRHSPVLFPFVGRLKRDQYEYEGNIYPMSQHGFARDEMFTVKEYDKTHAVFVLKSTPKMKKQYPFDFTLTLTYHLVDAKLVISYQVETSSNEMYFSIGAHPAFNVPLTSGTDFSDYYFQFNPSKSRLKIPLNGPLIDISCKTLAQTNTAIQIRRELFKEDAQILETSGFNEFSILSDNHEHGVSLAYEDFPYVGFWTPYDKEAPFICIEPWCGVADDIHATGELTEKIGINHLKKGDIFKREFTISIF